MLEQDSEKEEFRKTSINNCCKETFICRHRLCPYSIYPSPTTLECLGLAGIWWAASLYYCSKVAARNLRFPWSMKGKSLLWMFSLWWGAFPLCLETASSPRATEDLWEHACTCTHTLTHTNTHIHTHRHRGGAFLSKHWSMPLGRLAKCKICRVGLELETQERAAVTVQVWRLSVGGFSSCTGKVSLYFFYSSRQAHPY